MSFFTANYDDELSGALTEIQNKVTSDITKLRQILNDTAEKMVENHPDQVTISVSFDGINKTFKLSELKQLLGFENDVVCDQSKGVGGGSVSEKELPASDVRTV
jgi:hypothetical protein